MDSHPGALHAAWLWAHGAPEGFQGTRVILYLFSYIVFAIPTSNCDSSEAILQITSSRPIFRDLILLLVLLGPFGRFTRPNRDFPPRISKPLDSYLVAWVVWKCMESIDEVHAVARTLSTSSAKFSSMRRSIKEFAIAFLQFFLGLTVKFWLFCFSLFIVKIDPRM